MENDKEAARKLKKQERNHRYYLRHIERLQEKARNRYYLAREKDETSGEETERTPEKVAESSLSYESVAIFSALLVLPVIIVVVVLATEQKQNREVAITPPQNYNEIDIGGGKIIKVQTNIQP